MYGLSRKIVTGLSLVVIAAWLLAFAQSSPDSYRAVYSRTITNLATSQEQLLYAIDKWKEDSVGKPAVVAALEKARTNMKRADFWLRYLEPLAYKKINSPLPVEWETEVFEKFEQPYRREGAGLTLARLYLDEPGCNKDTLKRLVRQSLDATQIFTHDSITSRIATYHHFFLCNRLFLLNLAAIYTTGFECPDAAQVMPELEEMLAAANVIYGSYNESFPEQPLSPQYMKLFAAMTGYVRTGTHNRDSFDHYVFLKDYVNPLYVENQQMVLKYRVVSHSLQDYTLSKQATSIFDKQLYHGQNAKGVFLRVDDSAVLADIDALGRQLFFDPILSGNNERSCASCHKPGHYFTDTSLATPERFGQNGMLARSAPSLTNVTHNHLLMADGKHYTMQHQARAVISNPEEMNCTEKDVLEKILSCKEYKTALKNLARYTPQEPEVSYEHVVSCITYFYGKYSNYTAPFDEAMNGGLPISKAAQHGFNLFMGKAQCGTCHFVPMFNGVKPPYVGSEFEVLGVPANPEYTELSKDTGRYGVHAAEETHRAFRTGTVRNAMRTAPYMHNGVFATMKQVIDFYDAGGGAGHGLTISNQTLSADSLHLTLNEKEDLIAFLETLTEQLPEVTLPETLPKSNIRALNTRKPGGNY